MFNFNRCSQNSLWLKNHLNTQNYLNFDGVSMSFDKNTFDVNYNCNNIPYTIYDICMQIRIWWHNCKIMIQIQNIVVRKYIINDMVNVFYWDKWAFFPFKHICFGKVMIQKDKCQYWRHDNNKNKEKEKKNIIRRTACIKCSSPNLLII